MRETLTYDQRIERIARHQQINRDIKICETLAERMKERHPERALGALECARELAYMHRGYSEAK